MKRNEECLVARDGEGFADHAVTFGLVGFNPHGVNQLINARVAHTGEVEVAVGAFGAGADERL